MNGQEAKQMAAIHEGVSTNLRCLDMNTWAIVGEPGYAGTNKAKRDAMRDSLYGSGNWKTAFRWDEMVIDRDAALGLYEDAYVAFFQKHPEKLDWVCQTASDVYDNALTNVESGMDYNIQESGATHLQDIAVRRAVFRLGRALQGDHLVEIRGRESEGYHLNPGKVPFHLPDMILADKPYPGWIDPGSVECFWQSNKVLVVRKQQLRPVLAVDVIVTDPAGKVLLVDRDTEPKGWALPGGKVEFGESLRDAAVREVKEETGIDICVQMQTGVYDAPDRDPRHHFVSVAFTATVVGDSKATKGDGVKRARFIAPGGIPENMVCDHAKVLSDALDQIRV